MNLKCWKGHPVPSLRCFITMVASLSKWFKYQLSQHFPTDRHRHTESMLHTSFLPHILNIFKVTAKRNNAQPPLQGSFTFPERWSREVFQRRKHEPSRLSAPDRQQMQDTTGRRPARGDCKKHMHFMWVVRAYVRIRQTAWDKGWPEEAGWGQIMKSFVCWVKRLALDPWAGQRNH